MLSFELDTISSDAVPLDLITTGLLELELLDELPKPMVVVDIGTAFEDDDEDDFVYQNACSRH